MTTTRPKCDTLVSLRDHIEVRLAAQQMAVDAAKELMDVRLLTAEKVLEQRLCRLNQLRDDVITKTEFSALHNSLTAEFHAEAAGLRAEVAGLKEWRAEQGMANTENAGLRTEVASLKEWKAEQTVSNTEVAVLRTEVAELIKWKAEQKGKASVTSVYVAYVVSAILFMIEVAQLFQAMVVKT